MVPAGSGSVLRIAGGTYHTLALRDLRGSTVPAGSLVNSNGVFRLSVPSTCQRVYSLESEDDLSQSSWGLSVLGAGNGGVLTLSDKGATNAQGFYRVRRW